MIAIWNGSREAMGLEVFSRSSEEARIDWQFEHASGLNEEAGAVEVAHQKSHRVQQSNREPGQCMIMSHDAVEAVKARLET